MARSGDPNSASSQFFIMHADAAHLDGNYAAFGRVISGMGVVDAMITALSVRNSAAVEKNMELLERTLNDYQVSGNDEMDMMEQGVQLHFPVKEE